MTPLRLLYKIIRYWRCFSLLLVASFLSMFLIYASQNDPNMEYFGLGVKYFKNLINIRPEDMKNMVETNKLDYEFINTNSRFCYQTGALLASLSSSSKLETANVNNNDNNNNNNDFLGIDYDQLETDKSSSNKIDEILLLSVSQAANFRHRSAARQTWAKNLNEINVRLLFVIGNPFLEPENRTKSSVVNSINDPLVSFDSSDQQKLEKEMNTFNDIIQINMPDHENYKSTKILIAIRWSFTYCSHVRNLFILSDSAVLNVDKLAKHLKNKNELQNTLNNETIGGNCNLRDEKFSLALKLFYKDSKQQSKASKPQSLNNKSSSLALKEYNGEYCSNLGWLISLKAAKRLWTTALRSRFVIRVSPAYLNGFLVFKSNLNRASLFKTYDTISGDVSCLKIFSKEPDYLLCNEDFTIKSRYTSFIATWNWPSQGQLFHKL